MQAKVCASYYLSPVPSTKVSNKKKKKKHTLEPAIWVQMSAWLCARYICKLRTLTPVYFRNRLYLKGVFWGLSELICVTYIEECLIHREGSINVNYYPFISSSLLYTVKRANWVHRILILEFKTHPPHTHTHTHFTCLQQISNLKGKDKKQIHQIG